MKYPLNKSNLLGVGLTASLAMLISGAAVAQDMPASEEPSMEDRHHEMIKKMHRHRAEMEQKKLKKIDTNGDGKVDLDEFLRNGEERFKEMDEDGDGYVTAEEARVAHRAMRKKHREAMRTARKKALEGEEDPVSSSALTD